MEKENASKNQKDLKSNMKLERTKYYATNCPIAYYLENRSREEDYSVKRINKIISNL
jgi:hypothetical protein